MENGSSFNQAHGAGGEAPADRRYPSLPPPASGLRSGDGLTVEFDVHFVRGSAGRRQLRRGEAPREPRLPEGSIPRVARLMALAIRFEQLVRSGEVAGYAELARLGHVSRARMTQIMNLLHLAPDIQEAILFLPRTTAGRDPISERDLRPICAVADWNRQRRLWQRLRNGRQPLETSR